MGLFLTQSGVGGNVLVGDFLVVVPQLLLQKIFLLLGKLVVSQQLVVPGSFLPGQLQLLPQLLNLQFHTLPAILVIQSVPLAVVILRTQQSTVVFDLIQ